MQRWFHSGFPSSSICVQIFFLKTLSAVSISTARFHRAYHVIFLSLFVCCTNMKCENILTDIPSYYSYVHVQYLFGAISIFLFFVVINVVAFLQICTFLASHNVKRLTEAALQNSNWFY